MAKGDSSRAQNQIDVQGQIAQAGQNALVQQLYPQQQQMFNNYLYGTGTNLNDYNSIMRSFNQFMQNPLNPQFGGSQQFSGGPAPSSGQFNQGQPQGNQDYTKIIQDIQARTPFGEGALDTIISELGKQGIQAYKPTRAGGTALSDDKIVLPNQQVIDVIRDVGGPNQGWAVGDSGYWVDGQSSTTPGHVTPFPSEGGGGFGFDSIFGPMSGALGQALSGYSDFAETGGFSPQNLQDIRARATAPIKSVYSSGRREIDRAGRLGGGAVNKAAAESRLARDMNYATGDISQRAEADLAGLVQQGKLAGLGGLSQTGLAGAGLNQQLTNMLMQGRLGAMGGMTGLYGTTPALANTFGSQTLQGQGNLIGAQGLQNQLGLGTMGNQINKSQIPGDFSQAMGNIGSGLNMASKIISPFGIFGGGFNPSMPSPTQGMPNLGRPIGGFQRPY